jgi:hypothetical protein
MRTWILGSALLLALALPHPALAADKLDRWAERYDLRGAWHTKDADHDGVKNRAEYMLKTHPRRADSDRDGLRDGDEVKVATNPRRADSDADGIRDGDENAGVITAFDGVTITLRRFHGARLEAVIEDGSSCAGSDEDDEAVETEEVTGDDVASEDDPPAGSEDDEETEVDLGGDDDYGYTGCTDPRIKPGAIVSSIEIEDGDGDPIATAINLAPGQ